MRRLSATGVVRVGLLILSLLLSHRLLAAEEFRLIKQPVRIPERGDVTGYLWLVGEERFSFLPPSEWQVQGNSTEKRLVFLPRELTASISLTLLETNDLAYASLEPDQVRQSVLERYPEAKIREQFQCYTRDRQGEVVDVDRPAANNARMITRLAFVPVPGGIAEFCLTAPSRTFDDYQFAFGNLVATFSCEAPLARR